MSELAANCQIELAELKASPKQRQFQATFEARSLSVLTVDLRKSGDLDHKNAVSQLKIFAAIGGNRGGKTIAAGWLCFCKYLRDRAVDGDLFWCVAQTLDRSILGQQKELWEALPRAMFGEQMWDPKIGFGGHRRIVLETVRGKFVVEFRSSDQDPSTFEQAKLRGAWIDERCGEEVFDRLLPRIIDLDGWIVYSDIRAEWWQEERLFGAVPAAGVYCVQFLMADNPTFTPEMIASASATMTEDQRKMRIFGESVLREGIVFKSFTDDQIIKPFKIPAWWPRWRAIDYGSSAPTACLWFTISEDEILYVYREYYEVSPSVGHSAAMIRDLSGDEKYVETLIDPTAIATPPAIYGMAPTVKKQFEDAGVKVSGWPWIQTMGEHACVERVKFRDEHKTIKVFNTCTNHIRERRSWKHKTDKDGKPLAADAYENEHSHSCDCVKGFLATNPCHTVRKIEVVAGVNAR